MKRYVAWQEVADERAAEELLCLVRSFHDGVVIGASWVGAEVLNASNDLELRGFGTLHLTIDSQFDDVPRIELLFSEVQQFQYEYDHDISGKIEVRPSGVIARFLAWEVHARELKYSIIDRTKSHP